MAMDFFTLKLIEKIGAVFALAMAEKQYDRYQFLKKWCASETCEAIADFDETICSQGRLYILENFEIEYKDDLPDIDSASALYEEDMFWFGYLLTYWHFLDGTTGKEVLRRYDVCRILDGYDVLHTLSIPLAIENIKEDDRKCVK